VYNKLYVISVLIFIGALNIFAMNENTWMLSGGACPAKSWLGGSYWNGNSFLMSSLFTGCVSDDKYASIECLKLCTNTYSTNNVYGLSLIDDKNLCAQIETTACVCQVLAE
jgi:hypothetical protein